MNINDYITKLESTINSSAIASAYNLTIDRKAADIAFISGKIEFRNGSILDFKEFIEIKTFPHHKHLKSGKIVESRQMELLYVLEEIENIYIREIETDK